MGSLNPWLQAAPAQCVGSREPEASTGGFPAVNNIMAEPGRHGWAELLRLVGALRPLKPVVRADDVTWLASSPSVEVGGRDPVIAGRVICE
jgi:hypothetical protein